ncbi:MAG: Uma2 family endonuclease [Arcicella sp.]|jgi:Uma2 family endonuclease|nr:Uma2 family endonuclease [Arcicella sp.]
MNTAILQPIINSPELPKYIQKLTEIYQYEQKKRTAFYNLITEDDKAEFINGKAIFHSPVKKKHSDALDFLQTLVSPYVRLNKLGRVYVEKLMIELSRNSYEPDLCFFEQKRVKQFDEEQMLFPAPDFIVEIISKSTEKNDRGIKFTDYAQHQVKEYWIIDPNKKTLEQYLLSHGIYELNLKSHDGEVESKVIKGFRIPIKSIFSETENLKTLQTIITKP